MKQKRYKKHPFGWHRSMKTKQERVANTKFVEDGERIQWGRGKRRPQMLDPWGYLEKGTRQQKGWKFKRQNQYNINQRGERHEVFIDRNNYSDGWIFKQYCEEHYIPFHIEPIYEVREFTREIHERVVIRLDPQYTYGSNPHQVGWKEITKMVRTGEYKTFTYNYLIGHKLIWWSDKDIGIEYILNERV